MKLSLLVSSIILICGCSNTTSEVNTSSPDWLIPEEKMIEILADINIAEGATYSNQNAPRNRATDRMFILKKYNIADTIFIKSHKYYCENPKVLERIYEKVIDRLSEMEASVYKYHKNPVIIPTDSVSNISIPSRPDSLHAFPLLK